jgi:hypothetical protein
MHPFTQLFGAPACTPSRPRMAAGELGRHKRRRPLRRGRTVASRFYEDRPAVKSRVRILTTMA